jgi:hypothetical protein
VKSRPCKLCGFRPAVDGFRLVAEYDPIFRTVFLNYKRNVGLCADCQKENR